MDLLKTFDCRESYELPDKIYKTLFSGDALSVLTELHNDSGFSMRDYYQSEQGDRQRLKQDFTPDDICEIVGRLMNPGDFLDLCSGTGALTDSAVKHGHKVIHEREYSHRTVAFALLDACVKGYEGTIEEFDVLRNKRIAGYQLTRFGDVSIPEVTDFIITDPVDTVIMNPPYSLSFPDSKDFQYYGFEVPSSKADFGFVLNGLKLIRDGGRLIAILPHGVLFRGQKEGKIRAWLVKERLISAVIGLPDNMFMNTGIPVFLLVLERNSDSTLFIDASKECHKDGKYNRMDPDNIDRIVDTFNQRKEVDRFSHVAPISEMEEQEYNLNIPRYVDNYEPEPLPDMSVLLSELGGINREIRRTERELIEYLDQLKAPAEDMQIINRHKQILREDMDESV